MRKLWIVLAILSSAAFAVADQQPPQTTAVKTDAVRTESGMISISSNGNDVRSVLHSLFTQSQKNFVLEQSVRKDLYLALTGVEFEESLQVICKAADLDYDLQNGIYYISKKAPGTAASHPAAMFDKPKGRLPLTVLNKMITTKFSKTDFRKVVADISRQTNLRIQVDPEVKTYLLDAFLINTSLRYGLDMLTEATGLQYKLTDEQSIMIFKPNPNHVAVISGN